MENHGGMILTEETPDLFTGAFWQSYWQRHLVAKQDELTKEMMNFALQNIFFLALKGSLTCCRILHGADGFTSPLKESVLQIFIVLKNPVVLSRVYMREPWVQWQAYQPLDH
jgi:hypothetical protein